MSRARKSINEVEVKIRIRDVAATRRLLRRNGFRVERRRVFESNEVFDTPESALRANRRLLRLRRTGPHVLLTLKDKPVAGKHKVREEIELSLSDSTAFAEILNRLGFQTAFRYEKYRTEFARPRDSGLVLLDETPIGNFLELEGPPGWIDRTAEMLGFSEQQYITSSYSSLYFARCAERGIPPAHMVFSAHRRKALQ
jgi:adenylate cyclase, class 2